MRGSFAEASKGRQVELIALLTVSFLLLLTYLIMILLPSQHTASGETLISSKGDTLQGGQSLQGKDKDVNSCRQRSLLSPPLLRPNSVFPSRSQRYRRARACVFM